MECFPLFKLGPRETRHILVRALKEQRTGGWRLSTFNDLPTAMLFQPNSDHEGSLHYMFFPPAVGQKFHYHPGARYLLLIGDIDTQIDYSYAGIDENPNLSSERLIIPSSSFYAIRLRPNLWHRFETSKHDGLGVVAFSFHGNDNISDESAVNDNLMEEVTFFWEG